MALVSESSLPVEAVGRGVVVNAVNGHQAGETSEIVPSWTDNNEILSLQDENLSAYWKMENLIDSKNGHDLTNNGTATFSSGKHNNASNFNGTTQYLSTASNVAFNMETGDWTISAWIDFANIANLFPAIIANNISPWGPGGLSLQADYNNEGYISFHAYDMHVDGRKEIYLPFTFDVYTHVVIKRLSTQIWLYVNNSSTFITISPALAYNFSLSGLLIGSNGWDGANSRYNKQIDEFGIWKGYAATDEFVDALFNDGAGSFYAL